MTKRIRWRHWQELQRLERTAPRLHIPGGPVIAVLEQLPPFRPVTRHHTDTRCQACDYLCEVGHTVFTSPADNLLDVTLCYSCGVGWEMHNARLTLDQAANIPAIGGPRSRSQQPS